MSPTNTATVTPTTTTNRGSESSIELRPITSAALRDPGRLLSEDRTKNIDPAEFLPQPSTTVSVVERWNSPKANIYRTAATLFAFVIMGANDAAYGVSTSGEHRNSSLTQAMTGHHPVPRGLLWSELRHRFPGFPVTTWRICRRSSSQQLDPCSIWSERCRIRGTRLSCGSLHWNCPAPTLSCSGRDLYHCRIWQWHRRRCLECMGWEHGQCERGSWLPPWFLWPRRSAESARSNNSDDEEWLDVVRVLLHHGKLHNRGVETGTDLS
jgi:hypothetical protein